MSEVRLGLPRAVLLSAIAIGAVTACGAASPASSPPPPRAAAAAEEAPPPRRPAEPLFEIVGPAGPLEDRATLHTLAQHLDAPAATLLDALSPAPDGRAAVRLYSLDPDGVASVYEGLLPLLTDEGLAEARAESNDRGRMAPERLSEAQRELVADWVRFARASLDEPLGPLAGQVVLPYADAQAAEAARAALVADLEPMARGEGWFRSEAGVVRVRVAEAELRIDLPLGPVDDPPRAAEQLRRHSPEPSVPAEPAGLHVELDGEAFRRTMVARAAYERWSDRATDDPEARAQADYLALEGLAMRYARHGGDHRRAISYTLDVSDEGLEIRYALPDGAELGPPAALPLPRAGEPGVHVAAWLLGDGVEERLGLGRDWQTRSGLSAHVLSPMIFLSVMARHLPAWIAEASGAGPEGLDAAAMGIPGSAPVLTLAHEGDPPSLREGWSEIRYEVDGRQLVRRSADEAALAAVPPLVPPRQAQAHARLDEGLRSEVLERSILDALVPPAPVLWLRADEGDLVLTVERAPVADAP